MYPRIFENRIKSSLFYGYEVLQFIRRRLQNILGKLYFFHVHIMRWSITLFTQFMFYTFTKYASKRTNKKGTGTNHPNQHQQIR